MGIFAFLALLTGAMMMSAFDLDDDVVEPEDPDEPDNPDEPLDTGASFEQTEEGVTIEVGEDETRSVAAIHYLDTEDRGRIVVETDEVRYYLVPEGTDWSDITSETQFDVPGQDETENEYGLYHLEDFEASQGLELIGVVDVSGVPYETDDPDDRVGEVTSNVPIESYYLTAETDGDELIRFLPENFVVTRNGAEEVLVSQSWIGTAGTDWLTTEADGIQIFGLGGDDILESDNANVTLNGGQGDDTFQTTGVGVVLNGGEGNDTLEALSLDVVLNGGEGDDVVRTQPSYTTGDVLTPGSSLVDLGAGNDFARVVDSTVYGGTGNDSLGGYSLDDETLLYGEEGNDLVAVSRTGAIAYGGAGDDTVSAYNGATAFGGAGNDSVIAYNGVTVDGEPTSATVYGGIGNDSIKLDSGTTGYGGVGDDLFEVWNPLRYHAGPTTITTGEGDDTIDVRVRNAYRGEADDIFLRVTDFDPSEDILQVGVFQSSNEVQEVEIAEADDSSYTDVRVTYSGYGGAAPGIAVIRLEGTTGLSADQIVIT